MKLATWTRMAAPLAVVAGLTLASSAVNAQQYPDRDIHFICAFPPGSGADVLVRYFAEKVRPLTGKNVIVENKPGAGGQIALEYISRAKPDGYTVFVHAGSGVAASMSLFKNPSVDVSKQIQIAATINQQPYMIVVHSSKPQKSLKELAEVLKQKGEKGSYATSNHSSTTAAETFKNAMGLKTVQVDYRTGADMVNDVASGAVDFASADPVQALSMSKKGDWRILAISSGKRLVATGDLPTLTEQGVKLDLTGWWAAMVPQGTPKPVIDQINKWFVQVVGSEDTKKFLAQFGGDPLIETPEVAQQRMIKDIKEWGDNVKLAKIVPTG